MSKTTKIILALVAVAVLAVGAVVLANGSKTNDTVKDSTDSTDSADADNNQTVAAAIIYTDDGFSPSSVTVKSGESIRITNASEQTMKPSSAPHPVHTDNSDLNVGDIEPGKSKTFTVTDKGTWGYHNHYSSGDSGTIIVE